MTKPDEYLGTIARMEPDIAAIDLTAGAASIAVSLKRLADSTERLCVSVDALRRELKEAQASDPFDLDNLDY